MGTNCAPLIAGLFLFCYERNFMSNLQTSKSFDLIDKFDDNSKYLGNVFTVDIPKFEKHLPNMYQAEKQMHKIKKLLSLI